MLFYSEYKRCINQLDAKQKLLVFKPMLLLNLFLFISITFVVLKVHQMKINQDKFIHARTVEQQLSTQDLAKVNHHPVIDAKVSIFYVKDINLKDDTIPITFALSMTYPEHAFKNESPEIDLSNGTINSAINYYQRINNGTVNNVTVYNAHIDPHYILQLYPLDSQIISVRPIAKFNSDAQFTIRLSGMYDTTDEPQTGDYVLSNLGYVNPIESYHIMIGHTSTEITNFIGRAYMVFDHKNIYNYIKNIQYVILSITIALFSLLINSKSNSPKNGRVAVIGSSVFSLAANIFQINSTIRPTNALTIIDLITIFAGLIILLCFMITVKTLKLIDNENYEVSKAFDLSMFYSLLFYVTMFFILVYVYA